MLKVPILDTNLAKTKKEPETPSKLVLTNNALLTIDENGTNGQVVSQITWVTELGKQLLKAASEGNTEEIRVLMGKGAPFTADWLGTSPLHLAAQNNHLDICLLLLRAGISKDARTKVDRTPLHMAAYKGHYEIVECLLTNGAEVNCKDLLGMTPLHWAVQNAHTDIVSLLIRYGADTQVINKFDLAPLDIAMQIQKHDIADIISAALTKTENFHVSCESSNDSGLEPTSEGRLSENELSFPIETILLEDMDGEQTINTDCKNDAGIFNSLFPKPTNQLLSEEEDSHSQNENENEEHLQETAFMKGREDFSETVKLLQQHGITMLPPDETNIFTSVMNTGHQVVLTDIGKEMLNTTKPVAKTKPEVVKAVTKVQQKSTTNSGDAHKKKKIITVTPEEFLAMTTDLNTHLRLQKVDKFNCAPKSTTKRIVMKKSKVIPVVVNNHNNNNNVVNKTKKSNINVSDMELLMTQLIEVKKQANLYKKQAEEYKSKLLMKEAEAKMYKQQLLALQRNYCS